MENKYEKYFKEEMNSDELLTNYIELFKKIGRNNVTELNLMKEVYHRVLEIVLSRETDRAAEGWMTSY